MLIDVVRSESWEELNDSLKSELKLGPALRVRTYFGLAQAVYEITQSSAQFMSHKKAIGVVMGQTGVFEGHLPFYYKETYAIQTVNHFELTNIKEWVESLKKDTNFVIFSEDHPVTGERYTFADELDIELNKKRIGSYRISHANHFFEPLEVRPYTVRICSFGQSSAVAILGERYKAPPLTAQNMSWDASVFLEGMKQEIASKSLNPSTVQSFEVQISSISRPFFAPTAARIFDRAVCVFPEVSASALAAKINEKLGIDKAESLKKMATTNLCDWSVLRMFDHWWRPKPPINDLRGLLIFGVDILSIDDFAKIVLASHQELLDQQSWSL